MAKKKSGGTTTESVSIPLIWVGVDEQPVRSVTHAYSQFSQDGLFVLTMGMANPPVLLGDHKANQELLESLPGITVTPVARVAMTEPQTELLMKVLQANLKQYRTMKKVEAGE